MRTQLDRYFRKLKTQYVLYTMLWMYIIFMLMPLAIAQCEVGIILNTLVANCEKRGLRNIPNNLPINIKVLRLEDNNIISLNDDEFGNYKMLQEVYLSRNGLRRIAKETFRGVSNLQTLDLSDNRLSSVPSNTFHDFVYLKVLNLNKNPITRLKRNSFSDIHELETLDMQDCGIRHVSPEAFAGLKQLRQLNIANNKLTTLHSGVRSVLTERLFVFRIYGNPWDCDCRLRWLKDYIDNSRVNWNFGENTPRCRLPDYIAGKRWVSLRSENFACPAALLTGSRNVTVLQSDNITIMCKAYGEPQPVVTWYRMTSTYRVEIGNKRGKYVITESGQMNVQSQLSILNFQMEDVGKYGCIAENTAGEDQAVYSINITCEVSYANGPTVPTGGSMEGISSGGVAGIIIATLLLIVLLVLFLYFVNKYRDRQSRMYNVAKQQREKEKELMKTGSASLLDRSDDEWRIPTKLPANGNTPCIRHKHDSERTNSEVDETEMVPLYATVKHCRQTSEPVFIKCKNHSPSSVMSFQGDESSNDPDFTVVQTKPTIETPPEPEEGQAPPLNSVMESSFLSGDSGIHGVGTTNCNSLHPTTGSASSGYRSKNSSRESLVNPIPKPPRLFVSCDQLDQTKSENIGKRLSLSAYPRPGESDDFGTAV